jgi:hypothetical protein
VAQPTQSPQLSTADIALIAMVVMEVMQAAQVTNKPVDVNQTLVSSISKKLMSSTVLPNQSNEEMLMCRNTIYDNSEENSTIGPSPILGRTNHYTNPLQTQSSEEPIEQPATSGSARLRCLLEQSCAVLRYFCANCTDHWFQEAHFAREYSPKTYIFL